MAYNKEDLSNKFYSLQEVAKILRVSERSVFRYIHGGKLRATKIGYWRISVNDLQTFLLQSTNVIQYIGTQFPKGKVSPKKPNKKK